MGRVSVLLLVLAILYSDTNKFSCNVSSAQLADCLEADRETLINFKNNLQDPKNRLSSWQGSNCCQWWGVSCDNTTGAVVTINLPKAGFSGKIPPNLGNLSSLQYLDVSSQFMILAVDNLEWMTGLHSLKHLVMNGVDLSMVGSDWVGILNKLPQLTELYLSSCNISVSIPSLSSVNFTSLAVIDLSFNNFNYKFPDWLVNISSLVSMDISQNRLYGRIPLGLSELPNLQVLDLSWNELPANCLELFNGSWKKLEILDLYVNRLHGELPASIGNMTYLTDFYMGMNSVEGGIPSSIGKLCNLQSFDISSNNLTGSLPEFLEGQENCLARSTLPNLVNLRLHDNQLVGKLPEWLGLLESLVELSMGNNMLQGPIPASLGTLQNLIVMELGENELTGTLPQSFGQLSQLLTLDVSSNQLTGIVSEAHFLKLSKLKTLQLSSNSFTLNVSSNWVPPFQAQILLMGSCRVGPSFPAWIETQKEVMALDFSNASLTGTIPSWFWDISSNIVLLNVSLNQLQGKLPTSLKVDTMAHVDFSSNLFEGPIPLSNVHLLDLSNNQFSGPIPPIMGNLFFLSLSGNKLTGEIPASIGQILNLNIIDLSRNNLTGIIPSEIGNCSALMVLDLGNNKLSGKIPEALGRLHQLQSLHLSDNMLSGELSPSLQNLSLLETLDLGLNRLTGNLHPWIGDGLPVLRILSLRSNLFSGELPSELSNLTSLQILDLAENGFMGTIPASFGNLKAMTHRQNKNQYLFYGNRGPYYEESFVVNLKGQLQRFTKTLSLVTCIDLSGNQLFGEIPEEITKLFGMVVLNLSRNQIRGQIPESISKLLELSSLDLSSNKLSRSIPPSMPSLTFLSYLNLSNNNLTGRIPYTGQMSTFSESSFAGNPGLCGVPLVKCQGDDDPARGGTTEEDGDNELVVKWFYFAVGLGFAAGILVPYFVMAINKSWADAYFGLVDEIILRLPLVRNRTTIHQRNQRRRR